MYIRIVLVLLFFLLTACSPSMQTPLPDGSAPLAGEPGLTAVPPSSVAPAGSTLNSGPANSPAIGTPVPGWEDIPMMPGAYDSELNELVYLYSVDVPVDEAESYYMDKMMVNGWTLLNRQVMETSTSPGSSTILDFEKGSIPLNIMLVQLVDENSTAVILTRLEP